MSRRRILLVGGKIIVVGELSLRMRNCWTVVLHRRCGLMVRREIGVVRGEKIVVVGDLRVRSGWRGRRIMVSRPVERMSVMHRRGTGRLAHLNGAIRRQLFQIFFLRRCRFAFVLLNGDHDGSEKTKRRDEPCYLFHFRFDVFPHVCDHFGNFTERRRMNGRAIATSCPYPNDGLANFFLISFCVSRKNKA